MLVLLLLRRVLFLGFARLLFEVSASTPQRRLTQSLFENSAILIQQTTQQMQFALPLLGQNNQQIILSRNDVSNQAKRLLICASVSQIPVLTVVQNSSELSALATQCDYQNYHLYSKDNFLFFSSSSLQIGQVINVSVFVSVTTTQENYTLSVISSPSIICPHACSQKGVCQSHGKCSCFAGFVKDDCSMSAFVIEEGQLHTFQVPSNTMIFQYARLDQQFFSTPQTIAKFYINKNIPSTGAIIIQYLLRTVGDNSLPNKIDNLSSSLLDQDALVIYITSDQAKVYGNETEFVIAYFQSQNTQMNINIKLLNHDLAFESGINVSLIIFFSCLAFIIMLWFFVFCFKLIRKRIVNSQESEHDEAEEEQVQHNIPAGMNRVPHSKFTLNLKIINKYMPVQRYEDATTKINKEKFTQPQTNCPLKEKAQSQQDESNQKATIKVDRSLNIEKGEESSVFPRQHQIINLSGIQKEGEALREQKKDSQSLSQEEACAVCLISFEKEDEVRTTICDHIFHSHCLQLWLQTQENCPICRRDLKRRQLKQWEQQQIEKRIEQLHLAMKPSQQQQPNDSENRQPSQEMMHLDQRYQKTQELITTNSFIQQDVSLQHPLRPNQRSRRWAQHVSRVNNGSQLDNQNELRGNSRNDRHLPPQIIVDHSNGHQEEHKEEQINLHDETIPQNLSLIHSSSYNGNDNSNQNFQDLSFDVQNNRLNGEPLSEIRQVNKLNEVKPSVDEKEITIAQTRKSLAVENLDFLEVDTNKQIAPCRSQNVHSNDINQLYQNLNISPNNSSYNAATFFSQLSVTTPARMKPSLPSPQIINMRNDLFLKQRSTRSQNTISPLNQIAANNS